MTQPEDMQNIMKFFTAANFLELSAIGLPGYPPMRARLNIANQVIAPHLEKIYDDKSPLNSIYFTSNISSTILHLKQNNKAGVPFANPGIFCSALFNGTGEVANWQVTKDIFWDYSQHIYYPKGRQDAASCIINFMPATYRYYKASLEVAGGTLS